MDGAARAGTAAADPTAAATATPVTAASATPTSGAKFPYPVRLRGVRRVDILVAVRLVLHLLGIPRVQEVSVPNLEASKFSGWLSERQPLSCNQRSDLISLSFLRQPSEYRAVRCCVSALRWPHHSLGSLTWRDCYQDTV